MGGCSSKPQTAEHDGVMEAPLERLEEDQEPGVTAKGGNEGLNQTAALNSSSSFKTTLQESKNTLKSLFLQQEKDEEDLVGSLPKLHELLSHPLSVGKAGQKKPDFDADSPFKPRELQTEVKEDKEEGARNSATTETDSKTYIGTISDLISADLSPTIVDEKEMLSSGDDAREKKTVDCADVLKSAVDVKDDHAEAFKAAVNAMAGHAESQKSVDSNSYDHAEGLQPVLNNIAGRTEILNTVDDYSNGHAEDLNPAADSEAEVAVVDPVNTNFENFPIAQIERVKNVVDLTDNTSAPIDHVKTVVDHTCIPSAQVDHVKILAGRIGEENITQREHLKPVTEHGEPQSVNTVSSHVDKVKRIKEMKNSFVDDDHINDEQNTIVSDDQVSQGENKDAVSLVNKPGATVTVIESEGFNVAAGATLLSPAHPQVTPSDEPGVRDFSPVPKVEPIAVNLTNDIQNLQSFQNINVDDHMSCEAATISPPSPQHARCSNLESPVLEDNGNHVEVCCDPMTTSTKAAETADIPEIVPESFIGYSAAGGLSIVTREDNKEEFISDCTTAIKEKHINDTDIRTEEEIDSGGTAVAFEHEISQSGVLTKDEGAEKNGTESDCTGHENKVVDTMPDQSEPDQPIIEATAAAVHKCEKTDLVEVHSGSDGVTLVESISASEDVTEKAIYINNSVEADEKDHMKLVHEKQLIHNSDGKTTLEGSYTTLNNTKEDILLEESRGNKAENEIVTEEIATGSIKEEAGESQRVANSELKDEETNHPVGHGDEQQTSKVHKSEDHLIAFAENKDIDEVATVTPCLTAESKLDEPVLVGDTELEMKLTEDKALVEASQSVDADKTSITEIDAEPEASNLKP